MIRGQFIKGYNNPKCMSAQQKNLKINEVKMTERRKNRQFYNCSLDFNIPMSITGRNIRQKISKNIEELNTISSRIQLVFIVYIVHIIYQNIYSYQVHLEQLPGETTSQAIKIEKRLTNLKEVK